MCKGRTGSKFERLETHMKNETALHRSSHTTVEMAASDRDFDHAEELHHVPKSKPMDTHRTHGVSCGCGDKVKHPNI